jgi:hypothetical protein
MGKTTRVKGDRQLVQISECTGQLHAWVVQSVRADPTEPVELREVELGDGAVQVRESGRSQDRTSVGDIRGGCNDEGALSKIRKDLLVPSGRVCRIVLDSLKEGRAIWRGSIILSLRGNADLLGTLNRLC